MSGHSPSEPQITLEVLIRLNGDYAATAVLLALLWRGAERAPVRISSRTLAEYTRLGHQVVQRALLRLEERRLIRSRKLSRATGAYTVDMAALRHLLRAPFPEGEFLPGFTPYADWALLRADHRIPELRRALDRQAQLFSAELKKRADKGLGFGILKSREPKVLELGFRSPYGYVIAELIVEFDYYVRVVKTLGRKALFSDKEAHDAIRQFTRPMRAAFEEFIRFETWLTKPDLLALSRADFLPGADANAQKRVAAVTGIFGAVPAGIYAGHPISRHSQRRIAISETEKAMLERVAADIAAIDTERGAAGDEATDDGLVD